MNTPQVVDTVVLTDGEVELARHAMRGWLGRIRLDYRRNVRRGDERHAQFCAEKFDTALDLYERLGGDPDRVVDIEDT